MPRTTLYRNDGVPMTEQAGDELDYIDPGIVLLYADLERELVCSYFEGTLGKPIQATLEHQFEDGIDLTTLEHTLNSAVSDDLVLKEPPEDSTSSDRWALRGLSEEPFEVADHAMEALRRLVTEPTVVPAHSTGELARVKQALTARGRQPDDEQSVQLDFAVRDSYHAATLFKKLVQELSDTNISIAVSKSGRVDELEPTNIVIQIDDSCVTEGSNAAAIGQTKQLLDAQKEAVQRERLAERLRSPVGVLKEIYADAVAEDSVKTASGKIDPRDVFQEELNELFRSETDFVLVDRKQQRRRYLSFLVLGLLSGFTIALLYYDAIVGYAQQVAVESAAFISDIGLAFQDTAQPVLATANATYYAGATALSVLALAAVLVLRFRSSMDVKNDLTAQSARTDMLNIVSVLLALVLVSSVMLLLLGV